MTKLALMRELCEKAMVNVKVSYLGVKASARFTSIQY